MRQAEVFYHQSRTINVGNYESVKIDVGLTLSCDQDEVEQKYAECRGFVEDKLAEKVHEIKVGD